MKALALIIGLLFLGPLSAHAVSINEVIIEWERIDLSDCEWLIVYKRTTYEPHRTPTIIIDTHTLPPPEWHQLWEPKPHPCYVEEVRPEDVEMCNQAPRPNPSAVVPYPTGTVDFFTVYFNKCHGGCKVTPTPEGSTFALTIMGLICLGAKSWRR